jgi:hypothetical protein
MGRRVIRLLTTVLALGLAGTVMVGAAAEEACPPVTIADLVDPPAPDSTEARVEEVTPPCATPFVYPMTFPVMGAGVIGSPFGALRDGGSRYHLGVDIAAPKMQPVVAVSDGTVTAVVTGSLRAGVYVRVAHDDGWASLYVHLNDDTAGSDDGTGVGVRADLTVGTRVRAGEVIGWVGDSGNAEGGEPHLHFELHDPAGTPVDPGPSLVAAARHDLSFTGPFADLDEPDHTLTWLLTRGVPTWCDQPYLACPDDPATPEGLAPWLAAILGRPDAIAGGEEGVTAADLARGVVWGRLHNAYQLQAWWISTWVSEPDWVPFDPPPPSSPLDLSLADLYRHLPIFERCLPVPDQAAPLTRAQAADHLLRYLGWATDQLCPTNAANL